VVEVVALQTYALKVFVMAFLEALEAVRQAELVLEDLQLQVKVLLVVVLQTMLAAVLAAAVHLLLAEVLGQVPLALQVELVQLLLSVDHLLLMLVAAAVAAIQGQQVVLAAQVVVEMGVQVVMSVRQELQTQAAGAAEEEKIPLVVLVDQELLLFVTQTLMTPPYPQQDHQQLQLLAGTESTGGLLLAQ
jgi:hypothetical protein